jgi:4-amino-4-deoxy-L-arabinose transferase-like glycosyltransferase
VTAPLPGHPAGDGSRRRWGTDLLHTVAGRRAAVACLLVAAGLLFSLRLSVSGWANAYYSAAAQAGAMSWRAFLFGGLDPSGGITVDKPPAALWLTGLSVRLFGLSTPSLLLPQALCGVASVALLYATVRRQALGLVPGGPRLTSPSSPSAGDADSSSRARAAAVGLVAGGALALTPVVTLMARYDNPDALMVALSVGAAYALVRSVGAVRGGGGWLALAGALLGLAFLTKLLQGWLVLPAFVAVALVAGAGPLWRRVARVFAAGAAMLTAAGWWVLLVQLTPAADRPWIGGTQHNSVLELALGYNGLGRLTGQEGGGGSADVARPGNWFRLFGSWAPEASWLLPAAALAVSAGWALTRGRDRRDPTRAGLLLWGSWLFVVGVVLSSLRGISHSYYAVQLAPAVVGCVALGGALLWRRAGAADAAVWPRSVLATGVSITALWSAALLRVRPAWPISLAPVAVAAAAVTVFVLFVPRRGPGGALHAGRLACCAALVAIMVGPAGWSVATAGAVHRGANVVSGPGVGVVVAVPGFSVGSASTARLPTALVDVVRAGAPGYDWAAAVIGRHAADLQLAGGVPVWELGGYEGSDPHPTATEFGAAVTRHRVHYLLVGGDASPARSQAGRIARWASSHGLAAQQFSGWRVIDLSSQQALAAVDGLRTTRAAPASAEPPALQRTVP